MLRVPKTSKPVFFASIPAVLPCSFLKKDERRISVIPDRLNFDNLVGQESCTLKHFSVVIMLYKDLDWFVVTL